MPDLLERPAVDMKNRFNIHTYLKAVEVDERGDWWLVGVASGPRWDLQGERMSDRFIASMKEQIFSGQIPLRRSHQDDWDGEMGYLRAGMIDPVGELEIRVWIDKEMPYCQTLKRKLEGDPAKGIQPRKLGLSVGGKIDKAYTETRPDGSPGRVLDAGVLDHVTVTSCPAYPAAMISGMEVKSRQFARDWVADMAKAVDWRRAADPTETPAPPAADERNNAGGEPVSILNKEQAPPPPPPASETPPEGTQDEEAYKGGRWCAVKEVTEADSVWVKSTAGQQAPPPPPPPAEGEKSMDDKAAKALDEKLDLVLGKVGEIAKANEDLAKKNEALTAENDALKGDRKGIHGDGGGPGTPPPPATADWVAQLKASKEYIEASPGSRQGMLAAAMKKAGVSR